MDVPRALAIWKALDPQNKRVLERAEFISSWKTLKMTPAFKVLNPPRPSLPKLVSHVSIFSFTHGQYFLDFSVAWQQRFGKSPLPDKPLTISEFVDLLAEISYPRNPRTLARLLVPRMETVLLAPYSNVNIDHLAMSESPTSAEVAARLELLGRFPSEAIATWRSLGLRERRKKAQEIFGLSSPPKKPLLVNLWPPLREAVNCVVSKLPDKIENIDKIEKPQFDAICHAGNIEVGSYKYRILYAYLVTKEENFDLRKLPKRKPTTVNNNAT